MAHALQHGQGMSKHGGWVLGVLMFAAACGSARDEETSRQQRQAETLDAGTPETLDAGTTTADAGTLGDADMDGGATTDASTPPPPPACSWMKLNDIYSPLFTDGWSEVGTGADTYCVKGFASGGGVNGPRNRYEKHLAKVEAAHPGINLDYLSSYFRVYKAGYNSGAASPFVYPVDNAGMVRPCSDRFGADSSEKDGTVGGDYAISMTRQLAENNATYFYGARCTHEATGKYRLECSLKVRADNVSFTLDSSRPDHPLDPQPFALIDLPPYAVYRSGLDKTPRVGNFEAAITMLREDDTDCDTGANTAIWAGKCEALIPSDELTKAVFAIASTNGKICQKPRP